MIKPSAPVKTKGGLLTALQSNTLWRSAVTPAVVHAPVSFATVNAGSTKAAKRLGAQTVKEVGNVFVVMVRERFNRHREVDCDAAVGCGAYGASYKFAPI